MQAKSSATLMFLLAPTQEIYTYVDLHLQKYQISERKYRKTNPHGWGHHRDRFILTLAYISESNNKTLQSYWTL